MDSTEQKLAKLNRLYRFISQVNQALVKVKDEETLFKEACRIAIEVGNFRMAWIGWIDPNTNLLVPLVHAGAENGYLTQISISALNNSYEGRGPTGNSLRKGSYVVCDDIEYAPEMAPWKDAAIARGYYSSISLPLKKGGAVVGAFCLYAGTKNFFDQDEIDLLKEATDDISFGIQVIESEKMRLRSQEEAIRIYREKETILNRINDAIVSVDTEWRYTFLNEAALATHPAGRDEILGKVIWDVHPEMKGSIFWDMYHKSMQEKRVLRLEGFYEPMNTWFSVKSYPSVDGLTVFYRDITEEKEAQQKIITSEKRLRKAQELGRLGYWIWNIGSDKLWASGEAMKIWGFGQEEGMVPVKDVMQCVLDKEKLVMAETDLMRENKDYNIEIRIKPYRKNEIRFINAQAELERTESGALLRVSGTLKDITETKTYQQEIINEKQLSDNIINSLPGIFYLYTRAGKFLRWNKDFEKVSGYSGADIANMSPLDFFDETEREMLEKKIEDTFTFGQETVIANFLSRDGEKKPYYFTGKFIDYEGQSCLMGVGIDFSELKKAQELIKETTDQLRQLTAHLQSIREEERKRIGREIHDELGQQLTAIKMDIAWIDKNTTADNEVVKKKLQNVIGLLDGSHLSIRRILSELRPGVLDNLGLVEAMEWLSRQFTSNTSILSTFECTEKNPKISEAVATCVFRVYQESLTNIMRHASASEVKTSVEVKENKIIIGITDNGKGFDQVAIKGNKSFGILGMKERVLSLGGEFELNSVLGAGTKIKVSLPAIQQNENQITQQK